MLLGKGATGLFPVAMLALSARADGVRGLGLFAVAFSLAQAVAELADFTSQRHVARVRLAAGAGDVSVRLAAFNTLRAATLTAGLILGSVGLAASTASGDRGPALAILWSACWLFANYTGYASAMANGSFGLAGIGPWLGLIAGAASTGAAVWLGRPGSGIWVVVLGVFIGKGLETLWVWTRVGLPAFTFDRAAVRYEWRATRDLMLVGLVSAANARILVPLLAVVIGVVGAGFISVGLNLEAAILLVGVAVSVPAFRSAVDNRLLHSPREAFLAVRGDWATALVCSLVLTLAVLLASAPLTRLIVGQDGEALLPVRLVVAAAPLDVLCIFAGVFYHAAHEDRVYLRLSVLTTTGALVLVAAGGWLAGTLGAAAAFAASRAVSVVVVYSPLVGPGALRQSAGGGLVRSWGRRD